MLAVSTLRCTNKDENQGGMESFPIDQQECFPDLSDGNLLDSIDFDDFFVGINDGDMLPDLEMDPEILADFSISCGEESEINTSVSVDKAVDDNMKQEEEADKMSGSGSALASSSPSKGEEIVSKREEPPGLKPSTTKEHGDRARKSSAQTKNNNNNNNTNCGSSNNNQGKRKVKVDWTPELHRRFVQAVEQLGVDKAVPSRILEIMGIDCLTRHNIASHLQKYRSHRKHLMAREAEAANWSQRRQMYGAAAAGGGGGKRDMNPWIAPTIGFPPITPMHPHHHHHPFRPLHVWGHPSMDQSLMHMWPKHIAHSPSPPPPPPPTPPSWAQPRPIPPPPDPSYWHPHLHHRVPNGLTPGTPYFPQPLAATRFSATPVPGIPPHHAMYKVDHGIGVPTAQPGPNPLIDFHPSKESIDAAIGDVLSKPWLPLPLGLKPPSMDSVMVELQRQGIPKIPPTCA